MKLEYTVYARRMEIEWILINKGTTTRRALAQRFSVSIVTIGQDISAMSRYVPIYAKLGRYGGICIQEDYKCNRAYLSRDQEEVLKRLIPTLSKKDKILMETVLYKFKLPDEN